ncbi:MAG: acylphosphatase [Chloroflexi bacterium]|nr:acylphosphatase [Chloroflexota bacterium]MCL5074041.1 acylphosphatase [Chloroflexota bacterium]
MLKGRRVSAVVHGLVQGVGFRYFVIRQANRLGLTGFVRNSPDGRSVEVVAEGNENDLRELLSLLRVGPSSAEVERVDVEWEEARGEFSRFQVRF